MTNSIRWFALHTKPGKEKRVALLLKEKGIECLVPTYQAKRQWCYKVVNIELPLFPRYVFCCIDRPFLYRAVATSGVLHVVSFNNEPAEISKSEIDTLRLLNRSKVLSTPWKFIPTGVSIQIESGPLCGSKGVFQADSGEGYLIISVSLLQRSVAIHLEEDTAISVIEDLLMYSKNGIGKLSNESYLAWNLLKVKN